MTPDSSTRSTKADQLTVDLARRAHQSPGRLVDEDGLHERSPSRTADRSGAERRGGLPCVGACSPPGPLNRRRREDGLNSTHIFPVKPANACTEVTVTGKMSIGPPKDRCGRILETLPFARERPPFCLRKRNYSRDTIYTFIYTSTDEYIHTLQLRAQHL